MGVKNHLGWTLAITYFCITLIKSEDLPCRERDVGIEGRSVVCVCDAQYCDTITREVPGPSSYVAYTSSKAGKRFLKTYGEVKTVSSGGNEGEGEEEETPTGDQRDDYDEMSDYNARYRIYQIWRLQYIEGFGGSVTDAASLNWRKLSDAAQTKLLQSYFSATGIEYNMIRVPIAGCDFSTHPYTYNEYPWHDAALSNYSLTEEDLFYKLPMIKRAQSLATGDVKITASTWSPPVWMKTNEQITGFGQLLPKYYQAFADYHLRFIEEYSKAEVKIWAITTTNEPMNGIVPIAPFNSLGWTPAQLARWIAHNLGPTIKGSRFNDTLILAVDDQRYLLHWYMLGMEREEPKAFDYIDGVAIHYYGNFFPASVLSAIQRRYPNKFLLSTEACEGPMPWDRNRVEIGSWARAGRYAKNILDDLNNHVVGWIDWNLCLDENGGPNWANNFVDSPILVYGDRDEFIKQPMFYAMGHFSKFIPRGSRRVQMSRQSLYTVQNVAVVKPDGNIVVVMQNTASSARNVTIFINASRYIEVFMDPQSITTVEINQQQNKMLFMAVK